MGRCPGRMLRTSPAAPQFGEDLAEESRESALGVRQHVRQKPNGPIQLFNLKTDLGETTDRAAAHPDVVRRMADIMKTARAESTEFPLHAPAENARNPNP